MELIRLIIRGISHSQMQAGAYALLLEEESGQIKLPIIIGGLEARSIAIALEKNIQAPKSIHDLFVNFCKLFHARIKSVVIYKLADGIFSSYIVLEIKNEEEKRIDSRTSDAIALAIRFEAPIYTTREIFDKAGVYLEDASPFEKEKTTTEEPAQEVRVIFQKEQKQDLRKMTPEALKTLLKHAVDREHYEFAARIQKELDKRKQ